MRGSMPVRVRGWIDRLRRNEDGATAVEYVIMAAFIAAVIVAAVALLGVNTANNFAKVKFP